MQVCFNTPLQTPFRLELELLFPVHMLMGTEHAHENTEKRKNPYLTDY